MQPLKIVFSKNGLGKYYLYKDGKKFYPVIEIPIQMWQSDRELFFGTLEHEFNHYRFYYNKDNIRKKDTETEMKHAWPNIKNIKHLIKVFNYELKHKPECYSQKLAVNEDKSFLDHPCLFHYHKTKPLDYEEEKEIKEFIKTLDDI